jgi:hypothetical protein
MSEIDYASAPIKVRDDITEAHRRAWQRIAVPGTWWTGDERVAIAAEARNAVKCTLCKERKAALSPHTVEGTHESLGVLPEGAVDVIHRVVTDPGRLSKAWYEQVLAGGLEDTHYVEIIGVVITVVTIDVFCRGVGVRPHPLPSPVDGEPSRRRPESAKLGAAWVPMIAQGKEKGPEANLYKEGDHPHVGRALSLVPDEVRGMKGLIRAQYVPVHQVIDVRVNRSISRAQMELVAGRVSALNGCFY